MAPDEAQLRQTSASLDRCPDEPPTARETMKAQDQKKTEKKVAVKTPKEKKEAKKVKKEEKKRG